jgi:hypothetical protein
VNTLFSMMLHDLGQTISLAFVLALAVALYFATRRR